MSIKNVKYEIKYPIVLSYNDYHEFDFAADVMSKTLNDDITYTEFGFDYMYYAAFHPANITLDTEEIQRLQFKYNVSPD